jgi:hypothetical protein
MKPLSWLREEMSLYPRSKVDDANVSSIAEAIRAGMEHTIPPIVAEESTGNIIDGVHRRRAWTQVRGNDFIVPVLLMTYATEAEAFADAVRRNSSHGRRLNSNDETRSALRLRDLGMTDGGIAAVLRITPGKVEKLVVRVAISPVGEPVPLKYGDRHLMGRTLTQEQIDTLNHRVGVPYGRLAVQLMEGIQRDMIPTDPEVWLTLCKLRDALSVALADREVNVRRE